MLIQKGRLDIESQMIVGNDSLCVG